jgi:hypothetical protein
MWNGNAGLLHLAIFNFSLNFFAGGQITDAFTYFQFFNQKCASLVVFLTDTPAKMDHYQRPAKQNSQ